MNRNSLTMSFADRPCWRRILVALIRRSRPSDRIPVALSSPVGRPCPVTAVAQSPAFVIRPVEAQSAVWRLEDRIAPISAGVSGQSVSDRDCAELNPRGFPQAVGDLAQREDLSIVEEVAHIKVEPSEHIAVMATVLPQAFASLAPVVSPVAWQSMRRPMGSCALAVLFQLTGPTMIEHSPCRVAIFGRYALMRLMPAKALSGVPFLCHPPFFFHGLVHSLPSHTHPIPGHVHPITVCHPGFIFFVRGLAEMFSRLGVHLCQFTRVANGLPEAHIPRCTVLASLGGRRYTKAISASCLAGQSQEPSHQSFVDETMEVHHANT